MSEFVYKYLPPDRNLYFENELLRFTQPADLNDPFECIPVMPSIDETKQMMEENFKRKTDEIKKYKEIPRAKRRESIRQLEIVNKKEITKLSKSVSNFKTDFFEQVNDDINSKIGIFSLSGRWNSTVMWSHYGLSHKGFCIGFDRTNKFFTEGAVGGFPPVPLKPVIYSNKRIRVPTKKEESFDVNVIFTKSLDWCYEKEERLLGMFKFAELHIKQVPFDIYLFKVPHKIIREIILGADSSVDLQQKAHSFAKKFNVSLYKSVVSATEFNMERIPISL